MQYFLYLIFAEALIAMTQLKEPNVDHAQLAIAEMGKHVSKKMHAIRAHVPQVRDIIQ